MSMITEIRKKMGDALKAGDKETKQVYTSMLTALTNKAKELLTPDLTPEQEIVSSVFGGYIRIGL